MINNTLITAIIDSLEHGVLILNEKNNVEYINKKLSFWLKWNGQDSQEFIGKQDTHFYKKFRKLITETQEYDKVIKSIQRQKNLVSDNIDVEMKTEPYKYLNISTTPIHNSKSDYLGRLWIFENITKAKRLDQAKSEFISIASHQLRTPVSIINGYLSMVENKSEEIEAAQQGAQKLQELIEDLLNVSRLDTDKIVVEKSEEKIINLIEEIISEYSKKIKEKDISLETKYNLGKKETFPLDKKIIRHILGNLIENAIKYTPNNGEIKIKAELKNNNLRISVSDTGIGIPKKEQAKIFQKFFRAQNVKKSESNGTGIGLYYISRLIKLIKGRIHFCSEVNKGTEFVVEIPKEEK